MGQPRRNRLSKRRYNGRIPRAFVCGVSKIKKPLDSFLTAKAEILYEIRENIAIRKHLIGEQ